MLLEAVVTALLLAQAPQQPEAVPPQGEAPPPAEAAAPAPEAPPEPAAPPPAAEPAIPGLPAPEAAAPPALPEPAAAPEPPPPPSPTPSPPAEQGERERAPEPPATTATPTSPPTSPPTSTETPSSPATPVALDTVFLTDGGRVRGTVVEDTTSGVVVLMPDRTMRRLARAEVLRIEFAASQGEAARAVCPPCAPCPQCPKCPAPPPPRYAPSRPYGPPRWAPPPPPQPPTWKPPPARRGFQGALALQYAAPGGDVLDGLRHREVLPAAVELEAQLGWKLADRFFLGAYLGGGGAVPGGDTRDVCDDLNVTCEGTTARAGLMVKVDVQPAQSGNVWLGLASGVERHRVDVSAPLPGVPESPGSPFSRRELEMKGVEPLRLLAGVDFRSSRTLGVGVFAALSFGRYREVTEGDGPDLVDGAGETHTWLTVGVRGLLFP